MAETVIIPEHLIRQSIDVEEVLQIERDAFVAFAKGQATMPPKIYMNFPEGDLRCMPSHVQPTGAAGVKIVNVHPKNAAGGKLPTVMGTYLLMDPDTGFPLAVMGATWLTALRTGAAGALATQALAVEDPERLVIVGSGVQAHTQLMAHVQVMPSLKEVWVYGLNPEQLKHFREEHFSDLTGKGISLHTAHENPREIIAKAQVLVTVTPAHAPVVKDSMVAPGTHINALGADAPGKQELELALVKRARVFVDDWEQASHSGEINVAVNKGQFQKADLAGMLPEVLAGKAQGRQNSDEITLFDSTGLAVQDAALAHFIYNKLKDHPEAQRTHLAVPPNP